MKLHLPKALMAAVLVACAGMATAEVVTVNSDSTLSLIKTDETTGITVNAGTLTWDQANVSLTEGLTINNGGTVKVTQAGSANGFASSSTDVVVNGGGTLIMANGTDQLGYNETATKSISLTGSEGQIATLKTADRQTLSTSVTMNGYAKIADDDATDGTGSIDIWSNVDNVASDKNTLTVDGTYNTISSGVIVRKDWNIYFVDADATLDITGDISVTGGFNPIISFYDQGSATITGSIGSNVSGIYTKATNLTFGDGTTNKTGSVGRMELGDFSTSNVTHTVTVSENYTLNVTGSNNDTQSYKNASFIFGEWNTKTILDIKGTLNTRAATMQAGDSGGTINVSGVLATNGIGLGNANKTPKVELNLSDGGKIVLGAAGIDVDGKLTGTLAGGTIGISADKVTISENLNITGAVTVDTVKYNATELTQGADTGTLSLTGNLTGSGSLTVAGAGTLELGAIQSDVNITTAAGGTLAFTGTLTMGDGKTLTLTEGTNLSISSFELGAFALTGGTYTDLSGGSTADGNGFYGGTYQIVSGGTIAGSASLTYDGKQYDVSNDKRSISAVDYSKYYLKTGEVALSAIQEKGSTATLVEMSAGTLNVDAAAAGVIAKGNSTLNMSNDVTLTRSTLSVDSGVIVTLTGNGTFNYGSDITRDVRVGEGWTGKVVLDSARTVVNLNLNDYGNADSTITLRGLKGYFADGRNKLVFSSNIIMENTTNWAAIELDNGYSGDSFTFSGTISGGGNFVKNKNLGEGVQSFSFTGDVSNWTGNMNLADGKANVEFSGSASTINLSSIFTGGNVSANSTVTFANDDAVSVNSSITKGAGSTLNLIVGTAKGTTFKKTLNVSSLTVNENALAVIDAAGNSKLGSVTLEANATLKVSAWNASIGVETEKITMSMADGSKLLLGNGNSDSNGGNVYADISIDGLAGIHGATYGDNVNVRGSITGNGTLTLGSEVGGNPWTVSSDISDSSDSGTLSLKVVKSGANNNKVTLSGTNTYSGGTSIDGASLTATAGTALGTGDITITNGSLTVQSDAVTITKNGDATEASIAFVGEGDRGSYSLASDTHEVENARVEIASENDTTVGNKLTNAYLVNSGSGMVSATNSGNVLTGIDASAGSISATVAEQTQSLAELKIAASMSVTTFVSTGTGISYGNVKVNGAATIGSGATLLANLTLAKGAEVEMESALSLAGGSLTLQEGITLNGDILNSIKSLSGDNRIALFTDVSSLTLGEAVAVLTAGATTTTSYTAANAIDLKTYFTNLDEGKYYLGYEQGLVYAGSFASIPEPTTATLSLLALAALAARRRRR